MECFDTRLWVRWCLRQRARATQIINEEIINEETFGCEHVPHQVGRLELADFEREAVGRLSLMLAEFHGALLADALGLGKMCVAVATAVLWHKSLGEDALPVVCCVPARLEPQWRAATAHAGLRHGAQVRFVTHAQMSHMQDFSMSASIFLVDEAHLFKNPKAKRTQCLARWAAHTPLLLISALTLIKDAQDLYHMLCLFLREQDMHTHLGMSLLHIFEQVDEGTFDLAQILELVCVRRERAPCEPHFGRRPSVRIHTLEYDVGSHELWLWQNLAKAMRSITLEAWMGQWPHALFEECLWHRLEGGPAALSALLEELVFFMERWLASARRGHRLSLEELHAFFACGALQDILPMIRRSWAQDGKGYVQLCAASKRVPRADEVRRVALDLEVVLDLLAQCDKVFEQGCGRDEAIVKLAQAWPKERLLILTEHKEAAQGLFSMLQKSLSKHTRLGLMAGDMVRTTGLGPTTSFEVMRRFAPMSYTGAPVEESDAVHVLIATDPLSLEMSLKDCRRVVLADLLHNPLGVEQRMSSFLKPGGVCHQYVDVHLMRPNVWKNSMGMRCCVPFKTKYTSGSGDDVKETHDKDVFLALFALDTLASHLDAKADACQEVLWQDFEEQGGLWWQGVWPHTSLASVDEVWVFGVIYGLWRPQFMWCRVVGGTFVETRQSELMEFLIILADASAKLARVAGPCDVARRVHAQMRDRVLAYKSVVLEPKLLWPSAWMWWRWLKEHALALGVSKQELECWKNELWRGWPRGVEAQLQALYEHRSKEVSVSVLRALEVLIKERPMRPLHDHVWRTLGGIHLLRHA